MFWGKKQKYCKNVAFVKNKTICFEHVQETSMSHTLGWNKMQYRGNIKTEIV